MPRKKKDPATKKQPIPEIMSEVKEETLETTATAGNKEEGLKLEDLRCAYVVGLTPDDNFVFELFGQKPGLVELLGIHRHACKRVDRIYDDKQVAGDRLVHEVGKAVALVNTKLDQILQVIAPHVPDNKLS